MTTDFWWGMACIPAVVVLVALAAAAVLGLIYASARWDWGTYKLWPHDTKPEVAAAVIAGAKTRRYFWIPGFHVFVCRTRLFNADDACDVDKHLRVQRAVREAMAVPLTQVITASTEDGDDK